MTVLCWLLKQFSEYLSLLFDVGSNYTTLTKDLIFLDSRSKLLCVGFFIFLFSLILEVIVELFILNNACFHSSNEWWTVFIYMWSFPDSIEVYYMLFSSSASRDKLEVFNIAIIWKPYFTLRKVKLIFQNNVPVKRRSSFQYVYYNHDIFNKHPSSKLCYLCYVIFNDFKRFDWIFVGFLHIYTAQ